MLEFKAAILKKKNSKLIINKIRANDILDRGQVLVKLKFSGN